MTTLPTCPSYCTLPRDHDREWLPGSTYRLHEGPKFGRFLRAQADESAEQPLRPIVSLYADTDPELSTAELRELAQDVQKAIAWLEAQP
ncbi:hypothetical protein [Nocardioides marmoraquaticus]